MNMAESQATSSTGLSMQNDSDKKLTEKNDLSFLIGLDGLAAVWRDIGIHLGVPVHELNVIQQNNSGHVDACRDCLSGMFVWWLNNGEEITAKKLAEAIHKVDEHQAEVKVKQKYGISLHETCVPHDTVSQFSLPDFVLRYCNDMKMRYVQQSVLPDSDWPPSLGGQYIRLALIKQQRSLHYHNTKAVIEHQIDYTRGDYDKIMERKTKIELINAFDRAFCEGGSKIVLKMLIDGAPGVGKTTLSRKISSMWAKGEILRRYWLVLLLHLREKVISNAKTIDELFYHDDSDLKGRVVKHVKERSGDGVLIIFDGFDELSSYERSEESLFLDISKGKILHKCAVAITSRPYASRSLQVLPSINRHIEVLGFTDKQVKACIMKKIEDQEKAKELCTELKDRLDIASICQIPLNCSIVLYVYEQENYRLPRTLTELYELFILHSLKRFLGRNLSGEAADELLQLDQLRSPYKKYFLSLCELAFKGLGEDKLVFSKQDVDAVCPVECRDSSKGLPVLDLMTSAKSYSSRGGQDTHSFLHLTIQEFLAAYRLARYSSDDDKLKFCQQNLMESRYRMVLLFFSGLTKLEFPNVSSVFSQVSWRKDKVHICHLTYEAGNPSVCKHIAENHPSYMHITLTGSRFDKLVVSDFVANSGCQWQDVKFKPNESRLIHKVFSTHRDSTTCIKNVSVEFNCKYGDVDFAPVRLLDVVTQVSMVTIKVTFAEKTTESDKSSDLLFIKNLSEFFTGPQRVQYTKYFIYLRKLYNVDCTLHYSNILERFCKALGDCLVQSTCVTKITLNDVFSKGVHHILATWSKKASSSHLKCLVFSKGHIKQHRDTVSVPFLEFCTTLAKVISHNTSLEELWLQLFDIDTINRDGIDSIKCALAHNTTLQKLIFVQEEFLFERNQETRVMELKCTQKYKEKLSLTPSVILGESSKQNESPSEAPPAKRPRRLSSPLSVSDSIPASPQTSPAMELEVTVTSESSPSQTQVFHQSAAVECSSAEPSQVPYSTLSSDHSTTSHRFASNQTRSIYSHAVSHELSTSHAYQQNLMANAESLSLLSQSQEHIQGQSFSYSSAGSSQVSSPIPSSFIGVAGHQFMAISTRSNSTSHGHSVLPRHLSVAGSGANCDEPPHSATIASGFERYSVLPHSMLYHVNPEIVGVPQPTGGSSFVPQAPASRTLLQERPPAYPHYAYPQMFPPGVLMGYPFPVPWPSLYYQMPPPNQQQVNPYQMYPSGQPVTPSNYFPMPWPYPYQMQAPLHQQPTTSSQSVSTTFTTTTTN